MIFIHLKHLSAYYTPETMFYYKNSERSVKNIVKTIYNIHVNI